jgi:hypothetical protein
MTPTRRRVLAGAAASGASALLPAAVRAAARAERRFTILRDGSDIGRHVIGLSREGDRLFLSVDVEIVVRVLGIAAYRYEMRNREVWAGDRLLSIDSAVNDDGRRKTVRASREASGALIVASDFYNGPAPDDAATTTYFTPDFLGRGSWISTDSGELYTMRTARAGAAEVETKAGAVAADRWTATNGSDFDVELFYDRRGEWASIAFDAGGEPARYVADDLTDSFAAVWAG